MASDRPDCRPGLMVVDFQNDFCPPDGSLAVAGGRDLTSLINSLISLPGFVIKIATQDFHPANHISFATNHHPPNNKPFESFIELKNWVEGREDEIVKQRLWPPHCVQGTKGAAFIDDFQQEKVDFIVQKGMNEKSEMYSVFADAFGNFNCKGRGVSHNVVELLKDKRVSHLFIIGLAGDYCVRYTALDAVKAGFAVYVVEEATKCVNLEQGWADTVRAFERSGVKVVQANGPEINEVRWCDSTALSPPLGTDLNQSDTSQPSNLRYGRS